MTINETLHAGGFVVSENEQGYRTREAVTIALNQTLVTGQVLGVNAVVAGVTSSATADASNTGNGTITLDATAPVAASAKDGNYRAVCIGAATNSGTFMVEDPRGYEVGRVVVGATFSGDIKFVIADGATDFVVGDAFSIAVGVEQSDKNYVAYNPSGTDGSQVVSGILYDAITTDGVNKKRATIIARASEVRAADLTWPAGITAVQQASAINALTGLGIILR